MSSNAKISPNRSAEEVISFVFSEMAYFTDVFSKHDFSSGKSPPKKHPDDFEYLIHLNEGWSRIIGYAAEEQLYELSKSRINTNSDLAGRVGTYDLIQAIKAELGNSISKKAYDFNPNALVKRCVEQLRSDILATEEYFIPCIAPSYNGLKKFSIGPVTFINKESFFRDFAKKLPAAYLPNMEKFKGHHNLQNWIACVTIEKFSVRLAQKRANLCVRLAIASIKAQMALQNSKWLGTINQTMPDLQTYSMVRSSPDDSQDLLFSRSTQFILNGNNEDVEHLLSLESKYWFHLIGLFLEHIMAKSNWSFLENKLVTALIWLDVGNSHVSDAEKIIAFSNCLESLFGTPNANIQKRITSLSSDILKYTGRNPTLNGQVAKFYDARSKLVHGRIMPIGAELGEIVHLGKYLSDNCTIGMIHFTHNLIAKHANQHPNDSDIREKSFAKALDKDLARFMEATKEERLMNWMDELISDKSK